MRVLLAACLGLMLAVMAQGAAAQTGQAAALLEQNRALVEKSSRSTIAPVIAALAASSDPMAAEILAAWADKRLGLLKSDGRFVLIAAQGSDLHLTGLDGRDLGLHPKADVTDLRPNAGVRGLISSALVRFRLSAPDPATRRHALDTLARAPEAEALDPLRSSIQGETDPQILAQKQRLAALLSIRFDPDPAQRIAAIESFSGDLGLDLRGTLNPVLATSRQAFKDAPPDGLNIARKLQLGRDLPEDDAYAALVAQNLAPAPLDAAGLKAALVAHVEAGQVAGIPVASLDSEAARAKAYNALEAQGSVPSAATADERADILSRYGFYDVYVEENADVTAAARATLKGIEGKLAAMQTADLALDALSLASIYFLAAIGLAITFGVMGVINMAHGEFIMMGAYTGYVVQQFVSDYTLSLVIALPLAFAITFAAGVAMERLVIRHLYKRPLETLLATFGISIALQQLAKNIFGTQARPLTAPAWLDGQFALNDVVAISHIRIAIFVLALAFLCIFLWLMKRTRLGLDLRAVTQNPAMAASMGINPDRINMLTFGLGSGIAGVAGIAIGLFAKVTSELGNDYIVQSFMTVVVGGVGNIWGTLAGAALIGLLQKGIEWFNPSNTLAAQTYMILFIILFIQFRPRGIIALRGRAAGD